MYKILPFVIAQLWLYCSSFAQDSHLVYQCGTVIHGVNSSGHYFIGHCSNDILITSYISDGVEGTIVNGEILAERIRIEPGASRVRIVPVADQPNDLRKSHKHRTRTGSNGNTATSYVDHARHDRSMKILESPENNDLVLYPNPVVDAVQIESKGDLKIIGYDLISAEGKTLKHERLEASGKITLSAAHLSEGFYFLHIQTENGKIYHKTILKQCGQKLTLVITKQVSTTIFPTFLKADPVTSNQMA